MDQSQLTADARFRTLRQHCRRIRSPRDDPPHAQTPHETNGLFIKLNFADRLLSEPEQLQTSQ